MNQNKGRDYVKDGVLFCHKCHTPKETRVVIDGRVMTPSCLCKCEQEKKAKEEHEEQERIRQERVRQLRRIGLPDTVMEAWTFENDDMANSKVSRIAMNFSNHFDEMDGKGLLLYGGVGTGKTFISACIVNALIDKGHPCLMTSFSRLANRLQGMFENRQEYLDSINTFDLLVIDDLASERDTGFMNEITLMVIDERVRSGKPIIITTNLSAEELKHPIDIHRERIFSRIFEMCIPVEVKGKDRRVEKLKADYKDKAKILGL